MRNRKFQKNNKKIQIPLWLHFKPKYVGKGCEREKIKIILPFHSYPTHDRKFQKSKKYQCGYIMSQNRFEKAGKVRK